MSFALGGRDAISKMDQQAFDIVVSDMRMPGVDGAQVLDHAHRFHPETVRIVLSGYSELEGVLRAVPVAHQFLSKPCDAEVLENVVDRSCDLHALIADVRLRSLLGKIDSLPSVPKTYAALVCMLADGKSGAVEVAHVVETDIAMSAKLLQLVNSGFFGLPRRVTSIEQAVVLLGINTVQNLILSVEVFQSDASPGGIPIESQQRHAMLVGRLAARMLTNKRESEDAFLAGILHDVGILAFAAVELERLGENLNQAKGSGHRLAEIEQQTLGVTHAEVGAYLLGLWGLPYSIVEAVAHHHQPSRVNVHEFDVLAAVHVADALATERGSGFTRCESDPRALDLEWIESKGWSDRVDQWRRFAAEVDQAGGGP